MSWPDPRPGLVIRYAYLWSHEAAEGREEGAKDRPCAVLLAVRTIEGEPLVYVLPITHAPPASPADALEIPAPTKRRLGLDSERSWICLTEANSFIWPGPDLRFQPGEGPESAAYGMLPPELFRQVRERFRATVLARRNTLVKRTE